MLSCQKPFFHTVTQILYNKAKKVTHYWQKISASTAKIPTHISDDMSQHIKKGDIPFRELFIVTDYHASDRPTGGTVISIEK